MPSKLIGCSSSGFGILLNALRGEGTEGLPLCFNVRRVLESTSLAAAAATLRASRRDRPNNCTIVSPQGAAHLEITIDGVGVVRPLSSEPLVVQAEPTAGLGQFEGGMIVHTNHCLHPELSGLNSQFAEIFQSVPRLARATALLQPAAAAPAAAAATAMQQVGTVQAVLRDHQNFPRSTCRHSNGDEETGDWITVLSVVMDVRAGVLACARGPPCCNEYMDYSLHGSPTAAAASF